MDARLRRDYPITKHRSEECAKKVGPGGLEINFLYRYGVVHENKQASGEDQECWSSGLKMRKDAT